MAPPRPSGQYALALSIALLAGAIVFFTVRLSTVVPALVTATDNPGNTSQTTVGITLSSADNCFI